MRFNWNLIKGGYFQLGLIVHNTYLQWGIIVEMIKGSTKKNWGLIDNLIQVRLISMSINWGGITLYWAIIDMI